MYSLCVYVTCSAKHACVTDKGNSVRDYTVESVGAARTKSLDAYVVVRSEVEKDAEIVMEVVKEVVKDPVGQAKAGVDIVVKKTTEGVEVVRAKVGAEVERRGLGAKRTAA